MQKLVSRVVFYTIDMFSNTKEMELSGVYNY